MVYFTIKFPPNYYLSFITPTINVIWIDFKFLPSPPHLGLRSLQKKPSVKLVRPIHKHIRRFRRRNPPFRPIRQPRTFIRSLGLLTQPNHAIYSSRQGELWAPLWQLTVHWARRRPTKAAQLHTQPTVFLGLVPTLWIDLQPPALKPVNTLGNAATRVKGGLLGIVWRQLVHNH